MRSEHGVDASLLEVLSPTGSLGKKCFILVPDTDGVGYGRGNVGTQSKTTVGVPLVGHTLSVGTHISSLNLSPSSAR